MYARHFGLKENPFSITPDPDFLYMGRRHREALAHLLYGAQQTGGFIQLTGEVGTGKTTLTRALLQQLPKTVDVALLLNPKQTPIEFVRSICDELGASYGDAKDSIKALVDALNKLLIETYQKGRHTILIIDEAQNLTPEVLEQIRLLTNLETTKHKLLQIILVGQPELRTLLARKDLRQLAQRITGRYHLLPLSGTETGELIQYRLKIAGLQESPFNKAALLQAHKFSKGIPRLIVILCDRALLGAYAQEKQEIDARIVKQAAAELQGELHERRSIGKRLLFPAAVITPVLALIAGWFLWQPTSIDELLNNLLPNAEPLPQKSMASLAGKKQPLRTGTAKAKDPKPPVRNTDPTTKPHATTPKATPKAPAMTMEKIFGDPRYKSDTDSAFAQLFSLWHQDYHAVDGAIPCEIALKLGLKCYYSKGTWNNLRALNRPAIIELIDKDGQRHHAVISSLTGNNVELNFAKRSVNLPTSEIDPYWYGGSIILWKHPPVDVDVLQLGLRGHAINWLRQTMDKIEGRHTGNDVDDFFDHELKTRVIAFQQQRYLLQDGIVGEQTMIHLNTAMNDPAIPKISPLTSH